MKRIRLIGSCVALGGAAILSGCVAVPGPGYGYGYGSPYYVDQGPTVVPGASVYIEGGSGYYGRPYYGGPAYYGRPHGYYGGRPGYGPGPGPRPGWNGLPGGGRPPVVGVAPGRAPSAASIMRAPPGGHLREPNLADRP